MMISAPTGTMFSAGFFGGSGAVSLAAAVINKAVLQDILVLPTQLIYYMELHGPDYIQDTLCIICCGFAFAYIHSLSLAV
jgi:hypothetical protein